MGRLCRIEPALKPDQIAVSDRKTLRGLTQFLRRSIWAGLQVAEYKRHRGTVGFEGEFCDTVLLAEPQTVDSKDGEMSEWLKEHAWKACVGETLPWVRIPLSPPYLLANFFR